MIIINADDWGRSIAETDKALSCYKEGRITSASAMVFMEDSTRAAILAKDAGIDVGLHLNFDQQFTGRGYNGNDLLQKCHDRIVSYMGFNKYAFLFYNPILRKQFRFVYQAQFKEFFHLYGKPPSHIDGHHHMHLCSNMVFSCVISKHEKIRRNFSFRSGEKSFINRMYRSIVDRWLCSRYFMTHYFFSLSHIIQNNSMSRIVDLANAANVEIMTHPANLKEYSYLMSNEYLMLLNKGKKGTYSML
jgi:chitin disaccharide deacetylase